jgi:hypothetical protein
MPQYLDISVLTSQAIPYASATPTSRLMLFRETISVYCENHHKKHTHCVGGLEFILTFKQAAGLHTVKPVCLTDLLGPRPKPQIVFKASYLR